LRIIKETFLIAAGQKHAAAARQLEAWRKIVRAADWQNLVELRRTFPDADLVQVKSGRNVVVFNIRRNEFRLVAAIHFNRQIAYTLRFMTHAEYSKNRWKENL
jgi:mRNA interferase HigB